MKKYRSFLVLFVCLFMANNAFSGVLWNNYQDFKNELNKKNGQETCPFFSHLFIYMNYISIDVYHIRV